MLEKENEITIPAKVENLDKVLAFVDGILEKNGCPMKEQMQIDVAVEEIYVNIAQYAYDGGEGNATLSCIVEQNPHQAVMVFSDNGIPYDPLAKEDPDVSASAEERKIGGLGIFMVKKTMTDIQYEYRQGRNILTLKKAL